MLKFKIPPRLDIVSAAETEQALTRQLDSEKPNRLVCDFSETDYVSSAGLRIMLLFTKRMKSCGGECILLGVKQPVLDVFKMAGFDAILDIRDSID
jgi:anti-anti-sigma factor